LKKNEELILDLKIQELDRMISRKRNSITIDERLYGHSNKYDEQYLNKLYRMRKKARDELINIREKMYEENRPT
jgi:hypothetical protein